MAYVQWESFHETLEAEDLLASKIRRHTPVDPDSSQPAESESAATGVGQRPVCGAAAPATAWLALAVPAGTHKGGMSPGRGTKHAKRPAPLAVSPLDDPVTVIL